MAAYQCRSFERDIIPLRSRLTVGDSYADGDIFDSVNFVASKINSTEAMLPDSQQHGFTPVIHGIARGTAQVKCKNRTDTMFIRLLFHPALLLMISTLRPMVVICKPAQKVTSSIQTLYISHFVCSVCFHQRAGYTRSSLPWGISWRK